MSNRFFKIETKTGETISQGDIKLVPFSQAVSFHIPRLRAGVIWNRPVSVLAVLPDGQEKVLPVHDTTREVQIILLGLAIIGSILVWMITQTIKKGAEQ